MRQHSTFEKYTLPKNKIHAIWKIQREGTFVTFNSEPQRVLFSFFSVFWWFVFLELFRVRVCHHPNPAWHGTRRPRLHCNILLERHYLWIQVKMGDFTSLQRLTLFQALTVFLSLFLSGDLPVISHFFFLFFFFSLRCHRGHGEVRMSTGAVLVGGWDNRGHCPRNSESGPPCGPLTGSLHQ